MLEDIAKDLIPIQLCSNDKHCIVKHLIENIINKEIDLKRKLIEATNNVRKKFKQLKSTNTQSEISLGKIHKLIAKPLTSISDAVKQQQQQQQQKQQYQQQQTSQKFATVAKP